jgi:flagellin-specific chaperone FliS
MRKRAGTEQKKVRVSLDVTLKFYDRLEELEQLVDGESKASVIRQALQLYEFMVKRYMEGARFKIIKGGEEQELAFFTMPE